MADLIAFVGDFASIELATIGTVSVTLGLVTAFSLVAGTSIAVLRRMKGRG